MILHFVALNLVDDCDLSALKRTMEGLSALVGQIDGFSSFEHGANLDFERKSQDYPYGFLCRFTGVDALERYANDPRHNELGATLVSMCKGGADGIVVFDLEV